MARPYSDSEVAKKYPPNQRTTDGKRICSLCKKRLKGTQRRWCSDICANEFWRLTQWSGARAYIANRDKGVCAMCGADTLARQEAFRFYLKWWEKHRCPPAKRFNHGPLDNPDHPWYLAEILHLAPGNHQQRAWDSPFHIDHIIPLSEGGSLCSDDNLRTLCIPCHKAETALLRARLAKTKRIQRKHAAVRNKTTSFL
jgi:5-methylcytosine-specific restriction protein A